MLIPAMSGAGLTGTVGTARAREQRDGDGLPHPGGPAPGTGTGDPGQPFARLLVASLVDPHHFYTDPDADADSTYRPDADPDADLDSTFHPDRDLDPDPSFQIKAQSLEKVLK